MQIQVRKLRDAMELLKPVVPKKSAIEGLKSVLLQDGKLHASDLEVHVSIETGSIRPTPAHDSLPGRCRTAETHTGRPDLDHDPGEKDLDARLV